LNQNTVILNASFSSHSYISVVSTKQADKLIHKQMLCSIMLVMPILALLNSSSVACSGLITVLLYPLSYRAVLLFV
jgi:hypothetical protein